MNTSSVNQRLRSAWPIVAFSTCITLPILAAEIQTKNENLVPNPSFEDSGTTESKVLAWPVGKYVRDNQNAKFGKWSIKINGNDSRDAVSDKFPLDAGKKYVLSVWHKDDGDASGIYVEQLDSAGHVIATHYWYALSANWSQETYSFIARPDTAFGRIILRTNGESSSWMDMVELKEFTGILPIQGVTYQYSVQPNDGPGDPHRDKLTDGDTSEQWSVTWAGGIVKEGLNIDFDLNGKYTIKKVIVRSHRPQNGMQMQDAELYVKEGTDWKPAGVAPGYGVHGVEESMGEKLSTFEDIDMPAQKVRLRLRSPLHLSLTEVEICGAKP